MKKITGIEAQKDPNRVNIFLEGEFAFGLARTTAAWLQVGQLLDDQKIDSLKWEDNLERAKSRALNFLSYRDRSEKEVRDNLLKAEYPDDIIEQVLDRLSELSLVDDRKFTKAWVANRNEFRPRGKRALTYELRQKGISSELIRECLDEFVDEDEMAMKAGRKYLKKVQGLERTDFTKKLLGHLARKGFGYGIAYQVVDTLWQEVRPDGDQLLNFDEEIE